jgi:hypothetical protein
MQWDPTAAAAGDPEALAAVQEAERLVKAAQAQGATAFRVTTPDQPAQRLEAFDPTAEEIVVVPRIAGG